MENEVRRHDHIARTISGIAHSIHKVTDVNAREQHMSDLFGIREPYEREYARCVGRLSVLDELVAVYGTEDDICTKMRAAIKAQLDYISTSVRKQLDTLNEQLAAKK